MKIAVLCPGPSLPRFWRPSFEHDLVIGVNTVGWHYHVDWLAFGDLHIREKLTFQPSKGYIASPAHPAPAGLSRISPPLQEEKTMLEGPELSAIAKEQGMTVCAWTFPNALAQANRWAGPAGEVHVFGFDCAIVEKDFAGQQGYHKRKRWLTELPWVKSQWTSRTMVFSNISLPVLEWLCGEGDWQAVRDHFKEESPC